MTYYILCTITYIISYPISISCLLSCCGYTPMLYFSFTFLFSLLSVLYLFISFSCTILCTFYILYSCTVHFLYCFPVIFFIWLSLLCTCICCHIPSYDIHILCFSYTILFHILYFSYAVILYFSSCSSNCLYFHLIAVLYFSYHGICSIHVISF